MTVQVAGDEIIRRGISVRHLYWDEQRQHIGVAAAAFLLRPDDDGELSVYRAALESREETFARLQSCEALAQLIAEDVRAVGLEIEARPEPGNPAHAAILGLPTPDLQNPQAPETVSALQRAEELLGLAALPLDFRRTPVDALVRRLIRKGQVIP